MPRKLGNKKLTPKEHRQWKHVYASAKSGGATSPGGAATAAVKKSRRKK